ncbi:NAD(P)/FAD-dependent oxidoreductase [Halotalea alkalilenta]|uniref:NAD(P)/FAD-dependent oxidoreductase n=1 Tax=Halotalea alkalilenta TaxID=376489 RepID=UPI0004829BBA|nr:FAD-dependent oxidoreductase [Halotalea alkalilenta]
MQTLTTDIAIIGAGPAGAAAAAWLAGRGHRVRVVERARFPRFSIGESLLPQCMAYLAHCGLLETVEAGGYQRKNGAAFCWSGSYRAIDFRDKFSPGPGTTFQVPRADFDQRLIEGARALGAEVDFATEVIDFQADAARPRLEVRDEHGVERAIEARFVLDASGYGRVLARLAKLDRPSRLDERCALFTHVEDRIDPESGFDREKILIGIHPERPGVWFWLIPFSDGRASLGVVGSAAEIDALPGDDAERLFMLIREEPRLAELLARAAPVREIQRLRGYSADVSRLHGPGYALLGNAGEFLDPVFSSGVTVALHSAVLAAPLVERQLQGEEIDWQRQFELPLRRGVATFREFVEAWYDGRLPRIIFSEGQPARIRTMISAVLAGYAWDQANPLVSASRRRLDSLAASCTHHR